jgi:hypothetical protein
MGYVYALQFDDLAIKVGRSDDIVERISRLRGAAAGHGRFLTRVWSAWTGDPVGTEGRLIDFCLSHGTARPGTHEYFTGVPWDSGTWDMFVSQESGTASVPVSRPASVPVSRPASVPDSWGVRKVIFEGIAAGTVNTAGLRKLAKEKGFTSESWFFQALRRLQADGLIRRGVKNGIYELAPTRTQESERRVMER